ncbi:MAG: HD domain-containing protein [Treponema sp.]|jgi:HD-GYP domain-containing protein (c-di-GMP phosphodiesterase class II)|nr:HD domain-containing protein [Treponema sp.]
MIDTKERPKTYLQYRGLIERVERIFAEIAMNRCMVNDPFTSIAEKIYMDGPRFLECITAPRRQEPGLAKNAVDTAVISLGIAHAMGLADCTIHTLLLGSLLHDVGMFSIPQSMLPTKDLVKTEQRCILAHPIHGYNVILKKLRYHNRIGLVALQHHEYWNGTGYPQGLSGTAITLESRIVALGAAFAAMTSPCSYRPSITGHQAMNKLTGALRTQFDPDMLQVFVGFMGIYPRGSLVRLNTGAIARVIEQTELPLKPRIRILADAAGEASTEEPELTLTEEPYLGIIGEAEDKVWYTRERLYETRS